jgi:predicted phage gp36 major capsid-like protein
MTELVQPCPEQKGVTDSPELAAAFADFMGAFEIFKDTNDRRIDEIERKSAEDVLTREKLARIDTALDHNKRRLDELVL